MGHIYVCVFLYKVAPSSPRKRGAHVQRALNCLKISQLAAQAWGTCSDSIDPKLDGPARRASVGHMLWLCLMEFSMDSSPRKRGAHDSRFFKTQFF